MPERLFVLDAYAARSCPLKTVNAFNPTLGTPPRPESAPPPFFHDADGIEAEICWRLLASTPDAVDLRVLSDDPVAEQEAATLAALRARRPLVIGALLPRDWASHRSGRPSALLLAPDGSGYWPVQIKFHKVMETRPVEDATLRYSRLGDPRTVHERPGRSFRWGQRVKAALQLAHYWRLLEASGQAAAQPWGGLVGLEQLPEADGPHGQPEPVITWLDLGLPVVAPNPATVPEPEAAPRISTLERYDEEHAFRVRLATSSLAATGPKALLTPIVNRECAYCVWQPYCVSQLDADDLSLRISKAPLDVYEVAVLRELGVTSVGDLAKADIDAIKDAYLPRVSHRLGGEQRLRLAQHRARLIVEGVELERQTSGPIGLPRHALEIDLDIETSADDRVYLWGFFVDDHDTGRRYYQHFSAFTDLDRAAERALAAEAMTWLRNLVAGRDAAVYHYSDYEVVRLTRLANAGRGHGSDPRTASGKALAWGRDFAAEAFVDLFTVVKRNFFGANGLGLKVVVTAMTSFAWRDEDPSGLNSQSWFHEAVHAGDDGVREAARRRVLDYNEDDVRATWHLRAWLRTLT